MTPRRQHPGEPPPAIPSCPVCGQPLIYDYEEDFWYCKNYDCPQSDYDIDESTILPAQEAIDQQAKAATLDSLETGDWLSDGVDEDYDE